MRLRVLIPLLVLAAIAFGILMAVKFGDGPTENRERALAIRMPSDANLQPDDFRELSPLDVRPIYRKTNVKGYRVVRYLLNPIPRGPDWRVLSVRNGQVTIEYTRTTCGDLQRYLVQGRVFTMLSVVGEDPIPGDQYEYGIFCLSVLIPPDRVRIRMPVTKVSQVQDGARVGYEIPPAVTRAKSAEPVPCPSPDGSPPPCVE